MRDTQRGIIRAVSALALEIFVRRLFEQLPPAFEMLAV